MSGEASLGTATGEETESLRQRVSALEAQAAALRREIERWSSLLAQAPDVILTVDRAGRILFINHGPAGLTPEEAVATPLLDYIDPEHCDAVEKAIASVFETREPQSLEVRGRGAHDPSTWYSARVAPLREGEEVVALAVVGRDVTERRRSEERLRSLALRLEAVREQERAALAAEIDRDLGQALAALKLELFASSDVSDALARLRAAIPILDALLESVRRISTRLHPAALDDLGIEAAIEFMARDFARSNGSRCRVNLSAGSLGPDRNRDRIVYRTVEEWLGRLRGRTDVRSVDIALDASGAALVLRISFDGTLPAREHLTVEGSNTVATIFERAASFGGSLRIESDPIAGTTLTMSLPSVEPLD